MADQSSNAPRADREPAEDAGIGTQIVLSQSRTVSTGRPDSIGVSYDLTSPDGDRVKGLFFFHPLQPYTVKMSPKWSEIDSDSLTGEDGEDISSCVVSIHQIMNGKQVYEALNIELHPEDASLFHEQVCEFIEPIVGRAFQAATQGTRKPVERPKPPNPKQLGAQQPQAPQPNNADRPRQDAASAEHNARSKSEGRVRSIALPLIIGALVMITMVSAATLYRVMGNHEYAGPAPLPNAQQTAPAAQPNTLQPNFNEQREQPWTPN